MHALAHLIAVTRSPTWSVGAEPDIVDSDWVSLELRHGHAVPSWSPGIRRPLALPYDVGDELAGAPPEVQSDIG